MSVWKGKEICRVWRKSLLFKELPVPRTWWSDRWPGDRCCWPLQRNHGMLAFLPLFLPQLDTGTEQIREWKNGKERKAWTKSYLSFTQWGPEHPWTLPTRGRGLAILQWALVFSDKGHRDRQWVGYGSEGLSFPSYSTLFRTITSPLKTGPWEKQGCHSRQVRTQGLKRCGGGEEEGDRRDRREKRGREHTPAHKHSSTHISAVGLWEQPKHATFLHSHKPLFTQLQHRLLVRVNA